MSLRGCGTVMSGRCIVQTLAEFGFWATPKTSGIASDSGAHAFIYSGSEEVFVFDLKEKKLTGVLQFPTSVRDLVQSEDKQRLYVACSCGVYCVHLPPILSRLSSAQSSSPTELKIPSEDVVIRDGGVLCLLAVRSVLVTLSRRDTSWLFSVSKPGEQSGLYETLSLLSTPVIPTEERKPVMSYVCLDDLRENHLEPTLFKLLFGVDSALVNSPVVLCGLPDGRVCSMSLRLPGIRVLHSMEEPVVFVGASVVMETDAEGPCARCLVAVGEGGRVVAIKTSKGATEEGGVQVSFTEGGVLGPVRSACVDRSTLYLSTGSDLLSLRLTEERRGRDEHELRNQEGNSTLQSPISLNVCRITAMTKPELSTAGEVELLSLSDKGQLKRIIVPSSGEDGESSTQTTQANHSVKDLLSAIGDICERASDLKISITSKNQILSCLNQVANVSFLLLNRTDGEEQPIRCHASTQWTRLLQRDSLHLTCVLENNSPYCLELGWTLNITVCPLSDLSLEQITSTNYSFPLCHLSPGQKFEVTLPLAAPDDALLPLTISCMLVFPLGILFEEKQLASLLKARNSTISLPLNSLTVDWLHALQPCSSVNDKNMRSCARTSDALRGFLKSKGKGRVDKGESKAYSTSVKIFSGLIRDALMPKGLNGETRDAANVCVALLDWLLSEPHRGVAGHLRESTSSNAVLHSQGPKGELVKLVAKEVNVGDEKELLAVVEVRVESLSLATVCGLHHAILDRVQALVKRAPEKSSPVKVESLGLRASLLRTEHLLQQIHDSRVSGAFGAAVSSGQRTLLKVYQELRENPLIIM